MDEFLTISTTVRLVRINSKDIVCIEADGDYSTIIITGGGKITVVKQLGQLHKDIDEQLTATACGFVRVGKSMIACIKCIREIDTQTATVKLCDATYKKYEYKASLAALKSLKKLLEE